MKKNIEIVMLGDSITARGDWKTLLKNEHIVNLGVDGNTTSDLLSRISPVLELEANIVYLMIGVNDLCKSIPLSDAFENYKKIIKKLKSNNIRVLAQAVFLTQMPAVNKKVKVFNEMIGKYCLEENIDFLNLNSAFINEKGLLKEELTTDGLHLGEKAYKVWAYKLNQLY